MHCRQPEAPKFPQAEKQTKHTRAARHALIKGHADGASEN